MAEENGVEGQEVTNGTAGKAPDHQTGTATIRPRGRPKGSVNKVNRIAKEAILDAEPHSFLIRVMEGRKFRRAGSEGGRKTVDCFPTLRESISAAETLLRKVAPDMKAQELSGPAGEPIKQQILDGSLIGRDKELARRITLALDMPSGDSKKPAEAVPDGRPIGHRNGANGTQRVLNGPAATMPADGLSECRPPVGQAVTIDEKRQITVTRLTDDGRPDHGGDWAVKQGEKDIKTLRDITMEGAAKVVAAMDEDEKFADG